MSLAIRRVGGVINVGPNYGTAALAYTVPAGKKTLLKHVTLSSDNAGVNGHRIGMTIDGRGALWDNQMRDNYDSKVFSPNTLLTAGQKLYVGSEVANSYAMIQGVEMNAADMPTLHQIVFDTVKDTVQQYVVPTGKRFRIREILACPHSITTPFALAINNQAIILRRTLLGYTPQVLSVDISASAGEIIVVSASASAVLHVWLTGLLEDV